MIQLTYGEAKQAIANVCGVSGMSVTDPRVMYRTNAALQELADKGEWPNVVDRWHIVATDGNIVLPTFLDRLMQINVKGCPQTIASPWWQFVAYGPGTPDDNPLPEFSKYWVDERMISDLGEYPVQTNLPETGGPWWLRIYTTVEEAPIITDGTSVPLTCTIQGLDGNGQIIRTHPNGSWINGEQVALSGLEGFVTDNAGNIIQDNDGNPLQSFSQTVNQFSAITAFTKPATYGSVRLTSWDGTTETTLANYLFSDTTPSYHHYFSRWLQQIILEDGSTNKIVRARCRKRFVPVAEDTDVLMISNLNALKEMVIAQWKRDSDNIQSYMAHAQTAVQIMKDEALAYRGQSRIPGIQFQRGFALGSNIPALR
jgi:hypothetical protein